MLITVILYMTKGNIFLIRMFSQYCTVSIVALAIARAKRVYSREKFINSDGLEKFSIFWNLQSICSIIIPPLGEHIEHEISKTFLNSILNTVFSEICPSHTALLSGKI